MILVYVVLLLIVIDYNILPFAILKLTYSSK